MRVSKSRVDGLIGYIKLYNDEISMYNKMLANEPTKGQRAAIETLVERRYGQIATDKGTLKILWEEADNDEIKAYILLYLLGAK